MLTLNGVEDESIVVIISLAKNCFVWFERKETPKTIEVRITDIQTNFKVIELLL